jgi:hypothetical protein
VSQEVRFGVAGSWRAGTRSGNALSVETLVDVDSPEEPAVIAQMLRVAESACFTLQALMQEVPATSSGRLNGEPLDLGAS